MTIKILEYDQVDPFAVVNLNLLSLNYALTPERVELIRKFDPRVFPFFGLYAVEDNCVVGQVGLYRLPMISVEGPEDVGGISAVCTHPAYSNRGIASQLINEAHNRMRAAGLRFSTLGTTRHRGAYSFYRRCGYEDAFIPRTTFVANKNLSANHQIRVKCAENNELYLADDLFAQFAEEKLGFALRHKNFLYTMSATREINSDDVWLFWKGTRLAGYAIARRYELILMVDHLLVINEIDAASALLAFANKLQVSCIQVRVDNPSQINSLVLDGFPFPQFNWSTFMIKSLDRKRPIDDVRHLLGIGTEKFLFSKLDIT